MALLRIDIDDLHTEFQHGGMGILLLHICIREVQHLLLCPGVLPIIKGIKLRGRNLYRLFSVPVTHRNNLF